MKISRVRSYGNFTKYLHGESDFKVECIYMGEDALYSMKCYRKELR